VLGTAAAQKASVPKPQDKLALAEDEVKQLLLLMDTDKNGKISKQEWMRFMKAEFDRLDKAKNGQLDVMELTLSKLRASHFLSVGSNGGCALNKNSAPGSTAQEQDPMRHIHELVGSTSGWATIHPESLWSKNSSQSLP
jgi:hypothetical protein